jgi:hypothetical protein
MDHHADTWAIHHLLPEFELPVDDYYSDPLGGVRADSPVLPYYEPGAAPKRRLSTRRSCPSVRASVRNAIYIDAELLKEHEVHHIPALSPALLRSSSPRKDTGNRKSRISQMQPAIFHVPELPPSLHLMEKEISIPVEMDMGYDEDPFAAPPVHVLSSKHNSRSSSFSSAYAMDASPSSSSPPSLRSSSASTISTGFPATPSSSAFSSPSAIFAPMLEFPQVTKKLPIHKRLSFNPLRSLASSASVPHLKRQSILSTALTPTKPKKRKLVISGVQESREAYLAVRLWCEVRISHFILRNVASKARLLPGLRSHTNLHAFTKWRPRHRFQKRIHCRHRLPRSGKGVHTRGGERRARLA